MNSSPAEQIHNDINFNLANMSFDRIETHEKLEEKYTNETYLNTLKKAQELFNLIIDSTITPELQNISVKNRISKLNDNDMDILATLLSALAEKVGESIETLFLNDMDQIVEKMCNILSPQEIRYKDNSLIEDSNKLIQSITAINETFSLLKNGIENEIQCLKNKIAFSSFTEALQEYQKFYQGIYSEIKKKSLLCGQLITKAEIRISEDKYIEHMPSKESTKLLTEATGITCNELQKVFQKYHKRSKKILLLPQKLKEMHALLVSSEADFRKIYSYWAYLCAENIHPDDTTYFSMVTVAPFVVYYSFGYYNYIDHKLCIACKGELQKLHHTDALIVGEGLASKYMNGEPIIKSDKVDKEIQSENSEKQLTLLPCDETPFQMPTLPAKMNQPDEIKNTSVCQENEGAIKIAKKLLLQINAPKLPLENQFLLLKGRLCKLTESDIDNLVKILSILSVKLTLNEAAMFSYTNITCNNISKLASDLDISIKDELLIKNSHELINSLSLIGQVFITLRDGIEKELERLKQVKKKSELATFQKPLVDYKQAYKETSNEIKKELLLCKKLIEDTCKRASEDPNKTYMPSTGSINLFSNATGLTQTGLLKILTSYHDRLGIIGLLPEQISEAEKRMQSEVTKFRKKYCFLAYLCAKQIIPDETWSFSAIKKTFYGKYKFNYHNYIDNPLIFSMYGVLSPLNAEETYLTTNFPSSKGEISLSDSDTSPEEWVANDDCSSEGSDAAKADQGTDSFEKI